MEWWGNLVRTRQRPRYRTWSTRWEWTMDMVNVWQDIEPLFSLYDQWSSWYEGPTYRRWIRTGLGWLTFLSSSAWCPSRWFSLNKKNRMYLIIGYKVKIRLYTVCGLLHTNIDISSQSESENAEDEIREAFQVFDGVRFFIKVFSYYYCSIKKTVFFILLLFDQKPTCSFSCSGR